MAVTYIPDNKYIPLAGLQELFNDKLTGTALAGGYLKFFTDTSTSTTKDVYQLTQSPGPIYSFANIGNIVTLGAAGSPTYNGTDIQVYLYPYDSTGLLIQLYYIEVYSADNVLQFTRQAQPSNVQGSQQIETFQGSDNQIENPQFVITNLPSTLTNTYAVTGTGTVTPFAPDWSLVTTGAGNVVVTQLPLQDLSMVSGAPFAIRVSTTGSVTSLKLRQTISQSPRIFANGSTSAYAFGSIVAKSYGNVQVLLKMDYVPSLGDPINLVSGLTSADANFNSISNATASLITSTNTNSPLTPGYVNIDITVPVSADVAITSVQLVSVANENSLTAYVPESVPRQIDHLYHYAYPIVPIGSIIDFAGFAAPAHYLECNGTTYSRTTYQQLFNVLNPTETVTLTSTANTFTVASAAKYYIGMSIEGTGIPVSTTISNIVGTTITISNAATITGSSLITFFPWGNGNGSTTFTIPDLTDYATAGQGGSLFATNYNATGYHGGASTHKITDAEVAPHAHKVTYLAPQNGSLVAGGAVNVYANAGTSTTVTSTNNLVGGVPITDNTAMTIVQPTVMVYKYIRYE